MYLQSWNLIYHSKALPPCPWNLVTLLQPTITGFAIVLTLLFTPRRTWTHRLSCYIPPQHYMDSLSLLQPYIPEYCKYVALCVETISQMSLHAKSYQQLPDLSE